MLSSGPIGRIVIVSGAVTTWPPPPRQTSRRLQLPSVVAWDGEVDDRARRPRRGETHRREMLGATEGVLLDQHASAGADLAVEVAAQCRFALRAQTPRALLHDLTPDLRHA